MLNTSSYICFCWCFGFGFGFCVRLLFEFSLSHTCTHTYKSLLASARCHSVVVSASVQWVSVEFPSAVTCLQLQLLASSRFVSLWICRWYFRAIRYGFISFGGKEKKGACAELLDVLRFSVVFPFGCSFFLSFRCSVFDFELRVAFCIYASCFSLFLSNLRTLWCWSFFICSFFEPIFFFFVIVVAASAASSLLFSF